MVEVQARNSINLEDLKPWLAEHGVDVNDAYEAVIRIDRYHGDSVAAFLEVSYFLRNADGNRFKDETGQDAARATATVPLRGWPKLTPG